MNEEQKPWWQSKTILGAIAVMAATAAKVGGVDIGSEELTNVLLQAVTLVGAILAIVGRVQATKTIK